VKEIGICLFALFMLPTLTLLALNTLTGGLIPMGFTTWLATAWLLLMVQAGRQK
jgi:hypothetical protein